VAHLRWIQRAGGHLGGVPKRILIGAAGVALITGASHWFHATFSITSFLFLTVILLHSLAGDFVASLFVSIVATGCLDYFFVLPFYSFKVAEQVDVIALVSFLVTAMVVTRLVSRVRIEAESARRERQRLERLYRLAQQLLAAEPHIEPGARFLEPFRDIFEMNAIALFDADTAEVHLAGDSAMGIGDRTRAAYVAGSQMAGDEPGISIRRLLAGGRIIGCIGFEGLKERKMTAGPLAALAATLLERTRALRRASESAAAAKAETYRSAILDALAHEFKTPLATILAAAGGLRETGRLEPEQSEMTETIETEAASLGALTSRLLRLARLDREEVIPNMESVEINSFVEQLVDQMSRRAADRQISLMKLGGAVHVKADPELLRLAIGQLLENACKYSVPGSVVSLDIREEDGSVGVRVSNLGSPILDTERHRIFERFYRGSESSRHSSGSGLGLYVARKIALAHEGSLDLDDSTKNGHVAFCLAMPAVRTEIQDVVTSN
jgi:two-component system sensor histidine kinase KdpD